MFDYEAYCQYEDEENVQTFIDVCNLLHDCFGKYVGCGCDRIVFATNSWVYKVPLHERGCDANILESEISKLCLDNVAKCTLEEFNGIPILIMERVISLCKDSFPNVDSAYGNRDRSLHIPMWARNLDCRQVGYSRITGELVCYDFAERITDKNYNTVSDSLNNIVAKLQQSAA